MTFKRHHILNEFREYGLIPYNPNIVLYKIEEYQSSFSSNRPSTFSAT